MYAHRFGQYDFGIDADMVFIDPWVEPVPAADFTDYSAQYASGDYAVTLVPPIYDIPFDTSSTVYYDTPVFMEPVPVSIDPSQVVIAPASSRDFFDVLTDAGIAAIKLNQAYQATQKPPVRVPSTAPGTPIPNASGLLVTRDPVTGAVRSAPPPVGTPYVLGDGRTIINNGDGTFSLIGADGSVRRSAYLTSSTPDSLVAGVPNMLLFGALGLGAVLLLKR